MPALFSSSFSASPGGSVATTTLGSWVAKPAPMAKISAAAPTVSWGPERVAAELQQDGAGDGRHDGGERR